MGFVRMPIRSYRLRSLTTAVAFALAAGFAAGTVHAATITVTSTEDGSVPEACTLRDAIASANTNAAVSACEAGDAGHDDIVFAPDVTGTIMLTGGELYVVEEVHITGPGAAALAIDAHQASRVFNFDGDTALQTVLEGVTVTGGRTNADGESGGGIRCTTAFELVDSVVTGNSTAGTNSAGGGLFTATTTVLTRSTVSGNWTEAYGSLAGGVMVVFGSGTFTDSTIADNWTEGGTAGGGGVVVFWGWFDGTFVNSTVSGNATYGDASQAGGIAAGGNVILTNSTVSGNATHGNNPGPPADAGGITVSAGVTLTNSTVVDNTSASGGVAINLANPDTGMLTATNSLIANTAADDTTVLCSKTIDGAGSTHNLATDASCGSDTLIGGAPAVTGDLAIGPLADNGGLTKTHALLPGSAAIDAGDADACAGAPVGNLDQRGVARPIDGNGDGDAVCDIGAFEAADTDTIFASDFE